jgi:hypothetical protein
MKRIRSKNEQYTHGLFRRYVEMKKMRTKAGEAFVGMNNSGSQLVEQH